MGELLAIISAVFFALGMLVSRAATDQLDRERGLLISLIANAVCLGLLSTGLMAVRGLPGFSPPALLYFAAAGVCGPLWGRWTSLVAVERLGPSRTALYRNTQPPITALFAILLMGEPFTWAALIGGALVMAGIWYTSSEPLVSGAARTWDVQPSARNRGIAFSLLSAVGFSVANILRKSAVSLWPEPVYGATIGVLVALIGVTLVPGGLGQWRAMTGPWRRGHWLFVAFGLCQSVAQVVLYSSLVYTPVWVANTIVSTEPLLTILLSFILFRGREYLSRWVLLSAVAVMAGIVLLTVS